MAQAQYPIVAAGPNNEVAINDFITKCSLFAGWLQRSAISGNVANYGSLEVAIAAGPEDEDNYLSVLFSYDYEDNPNPAVPDNFVTVTQGEPCAEEDTFKTKLILQRGFSDNSDDIEVYGFQYNAGVLPSAELMKDLLAFLIHDVLPSPSIELGIEVIEEV